MSFPKNKIRVALHDGGLRTLLERVLRFSVQKLNENPLIYRPQLFISTLLLRRHMNQEEGLQDIISTTFNFRGLGQYKSIKAKQQPSEITALAKIVKASSPKRILEIGTNRGGTLYIWCRYTDANKIVSLDLPEGDFGGGYPPSKIPFFESFAENTGSIEFFLRNSHHPETLEKIKSCFEEPIDFLFIDGDHTYDGVKSDFEMYKPLVAENGIIALHDIVHHPNHPDVEVDKFWNEIKERYETKEIIASEEQDWGGIGVVYL